jgi:hypothetical protein
MILNLRVQIELHFDFQGHVHGRKQCTQTCNEKVTIERKWHVIKSLIFPYKSIFIRFLLEILSIVIIINHNLDFF